MNNLFGPESDHSLFRYLDLEQRERLESLARDIEIPAGEYLIRAGDPDSTLYGVESGRLEIVSEADGEVTVLATVGPGDILGEVSFIDDSVRSVSVRAGETTVIRAWDKDILVTVLRADPVVLSKFSVAMCELLVERLREAVRRRGRFRPA